ncbi:MAG: hypothetical protein N3E37_02595 [Candidatus Micrarchaeota archaeon]|nr:hypothetical protein [Candidatus Micrarchaeota archaeon]
MDSIQTEGKVKIHVDNLFYNPEMKFCRNLFTLGLMSINSADLILLDGFCSTGIRGLRYLIETDKVSELYFVDVDDRVEGVLSNNIKLNETSIKKNVKIEFHNEEFNRFLRLFKSKFDFIEIDPFGSPLPYLESAIHSLNENGYLSVTATDTQVLCGSNSSACKRYYGSKSLNNFLCHELAVRILLKVIALKAIEQGKGMKPLLSISDRHYVKVLCKLVNGSKKADESLKKIGYVVFCNNCHYYEVYNLGKLSECQNCSSKNTVILGPIWLSELNDSELLESIKKNLSIGKMPYLSHQETNELEKKIALYQNDNLCLLFYDIHKFCSVNKLSLLPTRIIKSRLLQKGFLAKETSFSQYGIKGNFSYKEFYELFSKR